MNKKYFLTFLMIFCLIGTSDVEAQKLKELWNKAKSEVKKATQKKDKKQKEVEQQQELGGSTSTKEPKPVMELDFGPMITFKAPNDQFGSFEMQSYKGLLRFGELNNFRKLQDEANKVRDYKAVSVISKKFQSQREMFEKFRYLTEIKYLKQWYDDMDREYFTTGEEVNKARPRSNNEDQTEYNRLLNSQNAQRHLLFAGYVLSSRKCKNKFFCNSESGDCTELKDNVVRTDERGRKTVVRSGIYRQWGGSRSSEFAQLRNFQSFSDEHLSTLQKWASSIWEKGFQELYYVEQIKNYSGKYDFKNKGYWLRLNLGYSFGQKSNNLVVGSNKKPGLPFNLEYIPKSRYEKDREAGEILFKISPEKAEELFSDRTGLQGYAVYKIKIIPNGIGLSGALASRASQVDFTFNLTSPNVELYSDIELTDKIGEVSFESAIYK